MGGERHLPTLFHAPLQEALNVIDGCRRINTIRDALSTEHGPIPLDVIDEWFDAMARNDMVAITPANADYECAR